MAKAKSAKPAAAPMAANAANVLDELADLIPIGRPHSGSEAGCQGQTEVGVAP
jgi:hypothetical protein